MSEIKITKERIIKASETCLDAKRVLKELFPEAFEDEWKDITSEIKWEVDDGFLHGYYEGVLLLTASKQRFGVSPLSRYCKSGRFKVQHDSDRHTILERRNK